MAIVHDVLVRLINLYSLALIIYIFMSWVPNARQSSVGQFLGQICEPFLRPFRQIIPPIGGMLDISPIAALLVLQFATRGLNVLLG